MSTRSIIANLMILILLMVFVSIGCTSDEEPEKKPDTTNESLSGSTGAGDQTAADQEGLTNLDTGISKNTTDGVVNPDGTITSADGTVTSADGTVTNPDGTTSNAASSIANAGDTATPIVNARDGEGEAEKPKQTLTRGDVNIKDKVAVMKTNFGDMYFFFFSEKAPNHVRNFIYLSEKDFYDGIKFHRIVPDFMAQGGLPRPDWTENIAGIKLEVDPQLVAKHRPGALAAARTDDPDSATSQFFIDFTEERTKALNNRYSVYGQMFKGFETLDKLNAINVAKNPQMGGEVSLPLEDVIINEVVIEDASKYNAEITKWKAENM